MQQGEHIGIFLRRWRLQASLSQEDLAERAGVSVRTIGALENGTAHTPRLVTLRLLADALGLSPEQVKLLLQYAHHPIESLPATIAEPLTPLVGRDELIETIIDSYHRSPVRLMTLLGPAGVGKTRVALTLARRFSEEMAVTWVSLESAFHADDVAQLIARASGIRETAHASLWATLASAVNREQRLLVLDNMEHLLDCSQQLESLLVSAPPLTILTTSRAPLRIAGEQRIPIHPLSVPDTQADWQEIEQSHAVQLFVQRVHEVQPDLAITAANATAIATLCQHLDGVPLALELAAARCVVFTPSELLERLDATLKILEPEQQRIVSHHQSLDATIAWSYAMLTPSQQYLFRLSSIFASGTRFALYEAIVQPSVPDTFLGDVTALLEQHLLLRFNDQHERGHLRWLEIIRAYAHKQLINAREESAIQSTCAEYLLARAEAAAESLSGPAHGHWLQELDDDYANYVLTLNWLKQQQDSEHGLRLVAALWRWWEHRGALSEGYAWLMHFIERTSQPTATLARAWFGVSVLTRRQGDLARAIHALDQALSINRDLANHAGIIASYSELGTIMRGMAEYQRAAEYFHQCLSACRAQNNERGAAICLGNLGAISMDQGQVTQALSFYRESLDLLTPLDTPRDRAFVLNNLAVALGEDGQSDAAVAAAEESLAIQRLLDETRSIAVTLDTLGWLYLQRADFQHALHLLGESLSLFQKIGDRQGQVQVLCHLGDLYRRHMSWRAHQMYWDALALCQELKQQRISLGALEGDAMLLADYGRQVQATHILACAAHLRQVAKTPLRASALADYQEAIGHLRSSAAFSQQWEAGTNWTWEHAVISIIALGRDYIRTDGLDNSDARLFPDLNAENQADDSV